MNNDDKNKISSHYKTICLLEKHLAFGACKKLKNMKIGVVGNWNGSNKRRALWWTGKVAQVQDNRDIWREKGGSVKSCRRSHKNMGCQRKIDAYPKRRKNNIVTFSPRAARAPHDYLILDNLFGVFIPCMLEASIEWVSQIDLAESNADAVLTSLALNVGGNVHLIAGRRIFTNKQDRKIFCSA